MQVGQKVRLLIDGFDVSMHEPIGDDRAMIVRFDDTARTGPIRSCQVRLNLDALDRQKDGIWDGAEAETVVGDCQTAIVILTSIPRKDMMALLEQMFAHMFPGGKMSTL